MKKAVVLFLVLVFLPGCASYRFQRGGQPYDKGYVVSRDDYVIPEYTLGKDNSVPDIPLAKERFKKRKGTVEHYYKKMGCIENRFKQSVWDPIPAFLRLVSGPFRLPAFAIRDYKYEHNPAYREKVKKMEAEQDAKEETRIRRLKEELSIYIQDELAREKA